MGHAAIASCLLALQAGFVAWAIFNFHAAPIASCFVIGVNIGFAPLNILSILSIARGSKP